MRPLNASAHRPAPPHCRAALRRLLRLLAWPWWLLCLQLSWAGPACARSGVSIEGLPGLGVVVAAAIDPEAAGSLQKVQDANAFEPWLEDGHGPVQPSDAWFRIDLTVPDALRGQTLWLQLVPATAWEVRLHLPDRSTQEAGMSLPNVQHSHPAVLTQFKVKLEQPQIRLYMLVRNTLGPLNHLSFLSDEALRHRVQASALRQGLFIGAAALMLLLALMNWGATREAVHRSFAFYIASALVLTLFTSGYVAAYLITDAPTTVGRGSLVAGAVLVSATVRFSVELLLLKTRMPGLAAILRAVMWAALALGLMALDFTLIALAGKLLWILHLLVGLLLLVVSGWQSWRQRTAQDMAVFGGYLMFNLFDKIPMLTMAGLLPVQHWSFEIGRLGLIFQLLLVHLHLVLRLRAQRETEQRALAASQEAKSERAQRVELSKFLAMFGHEVRTPLAIIDAATQSLEVLPGGAEPQNELRHQRIRAAVQRLDRLAREALSRERMASGSWQLRPRTVVLAVLVDDTLALQGLLPPDDGLWRDLLLDFDVGGQSGGSLQLHWPAGVPDLLDLPDLFADPDLLQVALGNLLDNARKYADIGSKVQLVLTFLGADGLACALSGGSAGVPVRLRFSVISQGNVLSTDELQKVFEKYWRRDEHGNVGGAGLGLHLVMSIARLHGGRAWAESLPGRCTAFHIELPLRAGRVV